MKALLAEATPDGEWLYEIKFDGFRALAVKTESSLELVSRNEKDLGSKFPKVVEALEAAKLAPMVLDGEIVALTPEGKSSFAELQAYELGERRAVLHYYVFDILNFDDHDLTQLPLIERRAILKRALPKKNKTILFSKALEGKFSDLMAAARERGLEGLIAKRKDSLYESGRRSGSWIKLKIVNEQEFVIGGYTAPAGSRVRIGALLIGYYEKGTLKFAGKVGTGFNEDMLEDLYRRFQKLQQEDCPFPDLPEKSSGRHGSGITRSKMKECVWLKTEMVCQVRFTEWTKDGKLRHPVFLGLREDKSANEVVREVPK